MNGFDYTVVQGDCLSSIAAKFALPSWRTIYDHPDNGDHRRKRPDPNILLPGDKLFIPRDAAHAPADTDRQHRFRVSGSKTRLRVALEDHADRPIANRAFRLTIGDRTMAGVTDANGIIDRDIPATATDGELVLQGPPGAEADTRTWPLKLGHLDPIDSVTGIQARLNNLGFDAGTVDGVIGPRTRMAVYLFQRHHGVLVDGIPGPQTRAKLRAVHGC